MTKKKDNRSVLWRDYEETIKSSKSLRGYGLNRDIPNTRIKSFRSVMNLVRSVRGLGRLLSRATTLLYIALERLVSFMFFRDFRTSEKFVFAKFDDSNYSRALLKDFEERFEPDGIYFSHNTMKSFSYLKQLEEIIDIPDDVRVLEVGGGLLNFGLLLSKGRSGYDHISVDLPGMIGASYREVTQKYDFDGEVFLPDSFADSRASEAAKKISYLEPEQIGELPEGFDLFVNHESFAEMDISTVNDYLRHITGKVREGGYIFLVNRLTRMQAKTTEDYRAIKGFSQLTNFADYDLSGFETLYLGVDPFRQQLEEQNKNPNVVYVGRRVASVAQT